MSFGAFVKKLRIDREKTLRQFCAENNLDPSNWSKIERGINPAPKKQETLDSWAMALGLVPDSEQWEFFMDQAAISREAIPPDLLAEKKIAEKLPVFFRTIRGEEITDENLDSLIKQIEELNTPDYE